MDFETLIKETADDCEQMAEMLKELAAKVREGDTDAFLEFFWEEGTEEGDAKILALREMIILRYCKRQEDLKKGPKVELQSEKV